MNGMNDQADNQADNQPKVNENGTITIRLEEFEEIKGTLFALDCELTRLLSQPLVHAVVVKSDNKFNIEAFEKGDRVIVLDKSMKKLKKFYGKIVSEGIDEEGWAIIEFADFRRDRLNVGLNGELPQIKLVGKDDGMNVVITLDGKLYEVHGLPGVNLYPSDTAKVDMESKQIHSKSEITSSGDVVFVKSIVDENHIEVESGGNARVVMYCLENKIEPSDRVMLDTSSSVVVRVLERDGADRFNLTCDTNISWANIAGLEEAKADLIEAIETPYKCKDLYDFYGMKSPKGILLSGPPGCGKTLLAKAAATSLAETHGAKNYESGFIYVKGPELLSKWVGESEQQIRQLFSRGKEHFEKHGYPALLFIDEADALLPMRGSGKSSDMENTIVPQFLAEMDGLEESHVMLLLATNQAKRLDPAIVRPGRIDCHVKVCRPNFKNSYEYFNIHTKGLPLVKGLSMETLIEAAINEIFSENHVIAKVTCQKRTEIFGFSDCISGAMIAGIVAHAKSLAMRRDLNKMKAQTAKGKGVMVEDFLEAIHHHVKSVHDLNASFDMEDFFDRHGFQRNMTSVEKIGAK